jgi:hypothetical protein
MILLLVLVFISGAAFAGGLFWFLKSQQASPTAPETSVAQGPEKKDSPAAGSTGQSSEQPAKKEEKAAPKNNPGDAKVEAPPSPQKEPEKQIKKPAPPDEEIPPLIKPAPKAEKPAEKPAPEPEKAPMKPAPPNKEASPPVKSVPKAEKPAPEPEKAPVKPAPKPQPPSEAAPLIAKLQGGTDEEKVQATQQLALKGEKVKEAARALCEASLNPSKAVARSALQALEKVAPELYEPVFTLLVDEQATNHLKATCIGSARTGTLPWRR